jgi:hypothetical protein
LFLNDGHPYRGMTLANSLRETKIIGYESESELENEKLRIRNPQITREKFTEMVTKLFKT